MHPFMARAKNKYQARKTHVGDLTFDSKGEARRWASLQLMERAGHISDLQRQVKFDLEVNGQLVCRFIADFTYQENGQLVVEDFKSAITRKLAEYRIKKKLMKACHNIEIRETTR